MNICHVDLWHAQTTKTTTNKTNTIQDNLGGSSVQKINMLTPTGIITPIWVNELRMLLYVVPGEFVWNEGDLVPATCYLRLISRCVIFFKGIILGKYT
jgi:hypothetical protein